MTYILMFAFLLVYASIILYGARYISNKEDFFGTQDTRMLKGIFCIIVVLVHIPLQYQNQIQDFLGSFAYIGVTYFFMTSSYGLKYSVLHKDNYLKKFWVRRLPSLLIPAFLVNIVGMVNSIIISKQVSMKNLIQISGWVEVLLLFYLIFWIVYFVPNVLGVKSGVWQDIAICVIVIVLSLVDRLTVYKVVRIWPTESIGFIYGIIIANYIDKLKIYINTKWVKKTAIAFILSLFVGVLYLKFKTVDFLGDYCIKIVLGAIILVFVLCIIRRIRFGNACLSFLGSISYEVYLLHGTIFSIIGSILPDIDSGMFIILSLVLTITIGTIISLITNFIKKVILDVIV